ncbi:hypothetical protein [Streptomyces sp. NBC_00076]|uniref:hypothetical protein n=1 Tax=Streptomyces sp. NBC_00076 TaxID=2975642 RepID=UPI00325166D4
MTKRRTREEKLAYEVARAQEANTRTSLAEYEIEQLAGLLRSSVLEWQPLTFDRLRAQAEATRKRFDRAAVLYGADTEKTRTEQSAQSNAALAKRESAYRDRDVEAVEWFVTQVLAASVYPHGFPKAYGALFRADTGDLLVEIDLPPADVIPRLGPTGT